MKMKRTDNDRRFPVVMWDQIQYFMGNAQDHQIRAHLEFAGCLDEECLAQAVEESLRLVPLWNCRYVERWWRPYWEMAEPRQTAFVMCEKPFNTADIECFLTQVIDPRMSPQIRVGLFRGDFDTLCVVINHMIADTAGFKEYLYLLADIYTRLSTGQEGPLLSDQNWSARGFGQLLKSLGWGRAARLLLMDWHIRQKPVGQVYLPPGNPSAIVSPRIAAVKIDGDQYSALVAYARDHEATLNDLFLAAIYRVLVELLDIVDGEITIGITVDLRRYLPGRKAEAICNLLSVVITGIDMHGDESFEEILDLVKKHIQWHKKRYIGLTGYTKYIPFLASVPYAWRKGLFQHHVSNPHFVFTNLGIIDGDKLRFHHAEINKAYLSGSIKYLPYSQLAVSTFGDSFVFTFNCYGGEEHYQAIEIFLSKLQKELYLIT